MLVEQRLNFASSFRNSGRPASAAPLYTQSIEPGRTPESHSRAAPAKTGTMGCIPSSCWRTSQQESNVSLQGVVMEEFGRWKSSIEVLVRFF